MTEIGRIQALGSFEDNDEPDSEEEENEGTEDLDEDADDDIKLQVKGVRIEKDSPLLATDKSNKEVFLLK